MATPPPTPPRTTGVSADVARRPVDPIAQLSPYTPDTVAFSRSYDVTWVFPKHGFITWGSRGVRINFQNIPDVAFHMRNCTSATVLGVKCTLNQIWFPPAKDAFNARYFKHGIAPRTASFVETTTSTVGGASVNVTTTTGADNEHFSTYVTNVSSNQPSIALYPSPQFQFPPGIELDLRKAETVNPYLSYVINAVNPASSASTGEVIRYDILVCIRFSSAGYGSAGTGTHGVTSIGDGGI